MLVLFEGNLKFMAIRLKVISSRFDSEQKKIEKQSVISCLMD